MDDAAPITSSPAAAPGPVPDAAPITSGPLTVGPSDAFQPTFDEGLETAASSAWNSLPTVRMAGAAAASDADAPVRTDDTETQSWFAGATVPLGHGGPTAPQPTPINPEDANAANKAAGGTLTPFTSPVGPNLFNHMLQQNLREQQSDATIARLAPGIGGTVARFGVGALVSLADPLNDAAMFIPGAPEAWVARTIAEAGGGLAARVGVRAASGAVQGAAGMAALQPLTALQDAQDHEDFSWGDALRQVAFGAMLGAGGGALHGLLGGATATPEDVEAVTKAAIARVVGDDPRGVDVTSMGNAAQATADANFLEAHAATDTTGLVAFHGSPHPEFSDFDDTKIGTGEGAQAFGMGHYLAEDEGLADWYRRVLSQGNMTQALEDTLTELHAALKERQAANVEVQQSRVPASPETQAKLDTLDAKIADLNKQLAAHGEAPNRGNLYQVLLKRDRSTLLDWDKPLNDQPPTVQAGLRSMGLMGDDAIAGEDLGHTVAPMTAEGAAAFREAGIHGIQYLDAKSRRAGEGTRNLVAFAGRDVQITHVNGVPVRDAIANLRAEAAQSANEMATRATNHTDPELVRTSRVADATIADAPKLEGVDPAKDASEIDQMVAIHKASYDAAVANGQIAEHPSLADAGKDELDIGKGASAYANCMEI